MLGRLNVPIDLSQTLFAAHGKQRMSNADQHRYESNRGRGGPFQPTESFIAEV